MSSTRVVMGTTGAAAFTDLPRRHPPHERAAAVARHRVWADEGQFFEIGPGREHDRICWAGVSRLGSVKLALPSMSVWVQMRGTTVVRSREGTFKLMPGDWIAFDTDSAPELQSGRHGLTLGLIVPEALLPSAQEPCLFVGKGSMSARHRAAALRLWRVPARQLPLDGAPVSDDVLRRALRPLLLHLSAVQDSFIAGLGPCPGHSQKRKRRVFNRMQRAYLYLQGNASRIVRISELAEITNYSTWYVSKTFHELYGESVQAVAARLRIERACDLLTTTAMDITEVAESCGFDNACSFARAFRARRGTTASEFRARRQVGYWRRSQFDLGGSAAF